MSPRPQNKDSFEYFATEHFRLSGVYWGLTALHLLGRQTALDGGEIVDWVLRCQRPCGGFGGSERHDAHLLYTLSALQVGSERRGRGTAACSHLPVGGAGTRCQLSLGAPAWAPYKGWPEPRQPCRRLRIHSIELD